MNSKKAAENTKAPGFSKEQLVSAKRYKDKKDILNGLLDDGREYTLAEVDSLLSKFLRKVV